MSEQEGNDQKKGIDLRRNVKEFEDLVSASNKAPAILDKLNKGQGLSDSDIHTLKKHGVVFDEDDTPEIYVKDILEGLIIDKAENKEGLKKAKTELENWVKPDKSDYQDSSDITADCDPTDYFDDL